MDALFREDAEVFISTLSVIEFLSNLQRLRSVDNAVTDAQFAEVWSAFSLDVATGRIQTLAVSAEVIDRATQLLLPRYVTPIDALQVAAAMSLGPETVVVSSDRQLNQLVTGLGVWHMDPSREE
jgi:predicted nucleic acid-binding protein